MSEEPAEVRRPRGAALKELVMEDLELYGTEELAERIDILTAEIERSKSQISRKLASRVAADAFFKRQD